MCFFKILEIYSINKHKTCAFFKHEPFIKKRFFSLNFSLDRNINNDWLIENSSHGSQMLKTKENSRELVTATEFLKEFELKHNNSVNESSDLESSNSKQVLSTSLSANTTTKGGGQYLTPNNGLSNSHHRLGTSLSSSSLLLSTSSSNISGNQTILNVAPNTTMSGTFIPPSLSSLITLIPSPNTNILSPSFLSPSNGAYEQLLLQQSTPLKNQIEASSAKTTSKSKKLGQILKLASVRGAKVSRL